MSKAARQDISVGRLDSATGLSEGGVITRLLVWEGESGEDLRENHDDDGDDFGAAVAVCAGCGAGSSGLLLESFWKRAMNFAISSSTSESVDLVDTGGVGAGAWGACPGVGVLGGDGEAQSQPILTKRFEYENEKK